MKGGLRHIPYRESKLKPGCTCFWTVPRVWVGIQCFGFRENLAECVERLPRGAERLEPSALELAAM